MSTFKDYSVDIDSPIAVYIQIENQVQFAIASGKLKPGENLPSVREMSTMLNINPNTVTKAYRDLEMMQLVNTRRGVGVSVADKAPKLCKEPTRTMVKRHLVDVVAECMACGYTNAEIRSIVSSAIESGAMPYSSGKKR